MNGRPTSLSWEGGGFTGRRDGSRASLSKSSIRSTCPCSSFHDASRAGRRSRMKRRTFDLLLSVGGLTLAVALFLAAAVFHSNASFAKSNVHRQLAEQDVFFPPKSALSAEELR